MIRFAKVNEGWCVHGDSGDPRPSVGTTIAVQKKDGTSSSVCVQEYILPAPEDGGWIVSIVSTPRPRASAPRRCASSSGPRTGPDGRYECEECGDRVYPGSRCWETGVRG